MRFLIRAVALFGMARAAFADPQTSIPTPLLPTVKCIYSVLKSSVAVQSVNVYRIDDFRLAIEYVFKGTNGQPTVSYVELVGTSADSAFLGDKIPREVPGHAIMEGENLESDLHLSQKCRLQEAFDNLFPQPAARITWHRIDLPKDFH